MPKQKFVQITNNRSLIPTPLPHPKLFPDHNSINLDQFLRTLFTEVIAGWGYGAGIARPQLAISKNN